MVARLGRGGTMAVTVGATGRRVIAECGTGPGLRGGSMLAAMARRATVAVAPAVVMASRRDQRAISGSLGLHAMAAALTVIVALAVATTGLRAISGCGLWAMTVAVALAVAVAVAKAGLLGLWAVPGSGPRLRAMTIAVVMTVAVTTTGLPGL